MVLFGSLLNQFLGCFDRSHVLSTFQFNAVWWWTLIHHFTTVTRILIDGFNGMGTVSSSEAQRGDSWHKSLISVNRASTIRSQAQSKRMVGESSNGQRLLQNIGSGESSQGCPAATWVFLEKPLLEAPDGATCHLWERQYMHTRNSGVFKAVAKVVK